MEPRVLKHLASGNRNGGGEGPYFGTGATWNRSVVFVGKVASVPLAGALSGRSLCPSSPRNVSASVIVAAGPTCTTWSVISPRLEILPAAATARTVTPTLVPAGSVRPSDVRTGAASVASSMSPLRTCAESIAFSSRTATTAWAGSDTPCAAFATGLDSVAASVVGGLAGGVVGPVAELSTTGAEVVPGGFACDWACAIPAQNSARHKTEIAPAMQRSLPGFFPWCVTMSLISQPCRVLHRMG